MSKSNRVTFKSLNLTQLRSFCDVCRLGGYAAAARESYLTPPAVWEQIKGLERHYGVQLIERNGQGVQPTDAGKRLLSLVHPLLASLDSMKDVLVQAGGDKPEQLTVVTHLRTMVDEIVRGLRRSQERHPSIALRMSFVGSDEIEPCVLDGISDVAVVLEPGPDKNLPSTLLFEPVGEVDFLLVAPRRHPLLRARRLQLKQIIQYPLVLSGEGPYSFTRHRVDEVFHRKGLWKTVNVAGETNSDEYTLHCVRAGMGVGIVSGTGNGSLYQKLEFRSLRHLFGSIRIGFLWQRGVHIAEFTAHLADALREELPRSGRPSRPASRRQSAAAH